MKALITIVILCLVIACRKQEEKGIPLPIHRVEGPKTAAANQDVEFTVYSTTGPCYPIVLKETMLGNLRIIRTYTPECGNAEVIGEAINTYHFYTQSPGSYILMFAKTADTYVLDTLQVN